MDALCGGPNESERAASLGTTVPEDTEVLGINVQDCVASVDLSDEYAYGGGSLSTVARVAQVVDTLTQFKTIRALELRVDATFNVSGRATVFEATAQIELVDNSGRKLSRTFTTATEGAPDRGRFMETLDYRTSATAGPLSVWQASMEDGSRPNEIEVPDLRIVAVTTSPTRGSSSF